MSFKAHLVVVCGIIIAVYLAWQLLNVSTTPVEVEAPDESEISPYKISVIHASWGLNCNNATDKSNAADKPREDNVLEAVAKACNGKVKCGIPVKESFSGDDSATSCRDKMLEIEYRCFS